MIIDCILDRKDNEKYDGYDSYNAHDFYIDVLGYGSIGDDITRAMDEGTEEDVKNALCKYIDNNEYNPEIKDYINSKTWLTNPDNNTKKENKKMTVYTINTNTEYNSTEVSFEGKPTEAIRDALKALRFRWHNVKKVWYGYKDEQTVAAAIAAAIHGTPTETKAQPKKSEKQNKYGVKVGDLFRSSWGYDQTNVNFFQVIALVGESSVRVREVYPEMTDEQPISGMSADRTYKLTNEILPPVHRSIFIKDQENGDLKRIKPGYYKDPDEANQNCQFNLDTFANAYKCTGDSITLYESWYA